MTATTPAASAPINRRALEGFDAVRRYPLVAHLAVATPIEPALISSIPKLSFSGDLATAKEEREALVAVANATGDQTLKGTVIKKLSSALTGGPTASLAVQLTDLAKLERENSDPEIKAAVADKVLDCMDEPGTSKSALGVAGAYALNYLSRNFAQVSQDPAKLDRFKKAIRIAFENGKIETFGRVIEAGSLDAKQELAFSVLVAGELYAAKRDQHERLNFAKSLISSFKYKLDNNSDGTYKYNTALTSSDEINAEQRAHLGVVIVGRLLFSKPESASKEREQMKEALIAFPNTDFLIHLMSPTLTTKVAVSARQIQAELEKI